ncbi:MAG: hypothetical protein DVB22_001277, partial [Verrucomicrobia bacterium]
PHPSPTSTGPPPVNPPSFHPTETPVCAPRPRGSLRPPLSPSRPCRPASEAPPSPIRQSPHNSRTEGGHSCPPPPAARPSRPCRYRQQSTILPRPVSQRDTAYPPKASLRAHPPQEPTRVLTVNKVNTVNTVHSSPLSHHHPPLASPAPCPNGTPHISPEHRSGYPNAPTSAF